MTAATNLLPMAAGVLLLGERLPARRVRLALRIGAFAAAVAGAWALAAARRARRTRRSRAERRAGCNPRSRPRPR